MVFDGFGARILLWTAMIFAMIVLAGWLLTHTQWYVTSGLCIIAALAATASLIRLANRSSREVAQFLDAIAVGDVSQSFAESGSDSAHGELRDAMTRVLARLRAGRSEREAEAHYFRALLAHVPVALLTSTERGEVELLNTAARRLFGSAVTSTAQLSRYGDAFAVSLESLRPGTTAILRMERTSGPLLLKAAVTGLVARGARARLISLQNIASEMSAHELAAWQTVIRVMAHEVMNSLTPVSSLIGTARDLVCKALEQLPAEHPAAAILTDTREALETVTRRSEGLLHFVQSHRRLTKPLSAQLEVVPVQRVFTRLQRLLAGELSQRDIELTSCVEPETLEITADADLIDQALINLVRNAVEALCDTPSGRIVLLASRDGDGRVVISVTDNGPGIPVDQRERIFVPFYTTKRHGSGIGLTIVRQIATAHAANIDVSQAPQGGATVSLRF